MDLQAQCHGVRLSLGGDRVGTFLQTFLASLPLSLRGGPPHLPPRPPKSPHSDSGACVSLEKQWREMQGAQRPPASLTLAGLP